MKTKNARSMDKEKKAPKMRSILERSGEKTRKK